MERIVPTNGGPLPGAQADRFLSWALPLLTNANSNGEACELALRSLHDFLTAGEASIIERYMPSILRSCQNLLEDGGTPLNLLRPLLGILNIIANRFSHALQPHFADLVDLLLGWALMPDLSQSDRGLIVDSFLQFQSLWAANLPFSSNLLSKFLGDMEVLAHDDIPGASKRLWALATCFVAVLRATTSGILEIGFKVDCADCLQMLLPRLLTCLGMVGRRFRTFNWIKEAITCLSLFGNLYKERFSKFSSLATDFLLSSLNFGSIKDSQQKSDNLSTTMQPCVPSLTASQVLDILKINMELLSLQGLSLPPDTVFMLLQSDSSFSRLRLHPSRAVTGVVTETYLFLLRHSAGLVSQMVIDCLTSELLVLKKGLSNICKENNFLNLEEKQERKQLWESSLTEVEIRELMKYDLLLTTCITQKAADHCYVPEGKVLTRAKNVINFLLDFMDPFQSPLQYYADVQFSLVQCVQRLHNVKCGMLPSKLDNIPFQKAEKMCKNAIKGSLSICGKVVVKALNASASYPVKIEVLDWLSNISNLLLTSNLESYCLIHTDSSHQNANENNSSSFCLNKDSMHALLTAASDREQKVRCKVATVLELLLYANLVDTPYFQDVTEVCLEHLGDPDHSTQNAFRQVLAVVAPASLWVIGKTANFSSVNSNYRQWRKVFALKRFSRHLRPQQAVVILNYIAQQWQVLPTFWIQRLIQNIPKDMPTCFGMDVKGQVSKHDFSSIKLHLENLTNISPSIDLEFLERVCSSSNLASAWWAIQEAAWHCVTARLRIHLGGPTQTFGVLERMLLDVVQSLQADNSQREGSGTAGSSNIQLLPMRLLLEFVDALKKNIYNATEGCIVLPNPSPASSHFFRTNRKVCEEWFARICEALMNASLALQCHTSTYHHAALKLHDLRNAAISAMREMQWNQTNDSSTNLKIKLRQDILKTLRLASLALCRAHEPSMILGLQVWASSTFGALLSDDSLSLQSSGGGFTSLIWMNGMALQAEGQYENSAASFSKLLQSDDALTALGADGVQFVIARNIESYVALADWEALELWLQELQTLRAQHAGKAYAGALTTAGHDMNSIHALACFDAGDYQGAWAHLDLTPQSSGDLTPDPYQALQRSEQMLLQALLNSEAGMTENWIKDTEKAKTMIGEALYVSGFDGITQAAPFLMHLHSIKAFEVKSGNTYAQEKDLFSNVALFNPLEQLGDLSLDAFYQDCKLWLKLLRVYKTVIPACKVTNQMKWHLVRLARKQHNFKLCNRLLEELSNVETHSNLLEVNALSQNFSLLHYERALLKYAEGSSTEATGALWNLCQTYIINPDLPNDYKDTIAKACLKLASWIKQKPNLSAITFSRKSSDTVEDSKFGIMMTDDSLHRDSSRLPVHCQQEVIGAAVKSATVLSPDMSKAWFAYGSWCFNHARLSFAGTSALKYPSLLSSSLNSEFPANGCTFTEYEIEGIRDIILELINRSSESALPNLPVDSWKLSAVQSRVQHIVHLMQMAAGAVEFDGESPSRMLFLQLKHELFGLINGLPSLHVVVYANKLMDIWWGLRKRRVSLYAHALQGFLRYLSFSNWKGHSQGLTLKKRQQNRQDYSLSSALYVLHILFNHGIELDNTLRKGLASVSPMPWQEVTAQLFARLTNHPEPQVRKQLEDLLMSLAESFPWAIVYPVLVNMNTTDGEPAEELQRLLDCLLKTHPKLVKDVQLMISELSGITILWEEEWLATLQDLHADFIRRISLLKEEPWKLPEDNVQDSTEKLNINPSKYSSMMLPIVTTLERTLTSTSRVPKTAHEMWFQEQYIPQIKAAITSFKLPPSNMLSINEVWRPFDMIVASLASHVKRSVIPLDDVAPGLVFLSSSNVPVPGLEKQITPSSGDLSEDNSKIPDIVTVTGFHKQVQVLATKTKPKKLTMVASDGQAYTYLLKGHEDLRLDARIMQLLRAVNGMLSHQSRSRRKFLAARYYSVTPIGGQAGLIQWVENLVSMYAVFKAWQQRNHSIQYANSNNSNLQVPPPVPRPSDMFYGKMLPALKERGFRKVLSRKDWPQEIKRKVFLELMKETPRQLLYKELWCASDGLSSFNTKLQRFSGTVAVMSMVGHIVGLGDRHLDNILMDFSTGDIVHIDYNVCFEKGLRLKIPEIVPFRLTQTIQAALGLTGVEGIFRQNCENVLETLRQNKDVILMLLDVFIWDPLTEWTKNDSIHEATVVVEEDKKPTEAHHHAAADLSHIPERPSELPVSEGLIGSQEARSQEVLMTSDIAESSPTRDQVEELTDMAENLGVSLEEQILSQPENDCWISPPNTGLAGSSDKEDQNHLESFWLQSADSLSGSRNWQSTLTSEFQKDLGSNSIAVNGEKVGIPELQLHSQCDDDFLDGDTEATQQDKEPKQINDELQTSMTPNVLQSENSNGILLGASSDHIGQSVKDQKSPSAGQARIPEENSNSIHTKLLSTGPYRPSAKRNMYAVSVLERVEWKLEGLDNEGRRHLTVSEQVDYLLRQAMSIDNLCNMYEGWTAWI